MIALAGRLNVLLSGRAVVFISFDLEFEPCVVIPHIKYVTYKTSLTLSSLIYSVFVFIFYVIINLKFSF